MLAECDVHHKLFTNHSVATVPVAKWQRGRRHTKVSPWKYMIPWSITILFDVDLTNTYGDMAENVIM